MRSPRRPTLVRGVSGWGEFLATEPTGARPLKTARRLEEDTIQTHQGGAGPDKGALVLRTTMALRFVVVIKTTLTELAVERFFTLVITAPTHC